MKHRLFYNIQNNADSADIFIYGAIGWDWYTSNTANQFVRDFRVLEDKYNRINVHINSPGGDIHEGLPISNVIRASKKDVHTYVDGIAYSMGAIIAISAKKGNVHIASNGMIMLHNASTIAFGNSKDFRKTADDLDKYDTSLAQTVADRTGLSNSDVMAKWFDHVDHFFTADEAKAEGLVDIIESYSAENIPANIKNMKSSEVFEYYEKLTEDKQEGFLTNILNKVKDHVTQTFKSLSNTKEPMDFKNALSILAKDQITPDERKAVTADINAYLQAGEKFNKAELDAAVKAASDTAVTAAVDAAIKPLNEKITTLETDKKKVENEFAAFKDSTSTGVDPINKDKKDPGGKDAKNDFLTPEDAELEKMKSQS